MGRRGYCRSRREIAGNSCLSHSPSARPSTLPSASPTNSCSARSPGPGYSRCCTWTPTSAHSQAGPAAPMDHLERQASAEPAVTPGPAAQKVPPPRLPGRRGPSQGSVGEDSGARSQETPRTSLPREPLPDMPGCRQGTLRAPSPLGRAQLLHSEASSLKEEADSWTMKNHQGRVNGPRAVEPWEGLALPWSTCTSHPRELPSFPPCLPGSHGSYLTQRSTAPSPPPQLKPIEPSIPGPSGG